jgi:hypothetical protein
MLTKVRVWSACRRPVASTLLYAALVAFGAAPLFPGVRPAYGAEGGKTHSVADRLMAQGAAAIAAKDYAAAQTALIEGYRTYQNPLILYHLGALRAAEQKSLEAQDLLRRFLADSTVEPSEPLRQEAQKLLASLPPAEAGEVQLSAPRGAEVLVDNTLVGAIPLPLPLLLSVGTHQVTVQQGKWRAVSPAKVKVSRLLELRFKAGSDVVVATEPPTVLLVDSYPDPALQDPARQRLGGIIRRENMAVLLGASAAGNARELGPAPACLADPGCQHRLAEKFGSDYLLTVQVTRSPADPKGLGAQLELYDILVGASAATGSATCSGCTPEAAAAKLGDAVSSLLSTASARGRGEVAITSVPPDAEVLLDGQPAGRTPLKKTLFAGSYELTVRKDSLRPQTQQLTIGPGDPVQLAVTLVPEGAAPTPPTTPPPPGPLRRPRWRLAVGGAALGLGAVLTGFGISALKVDGTCVYGSDGSGLPPEMGGCMDMGMDMDHPYYMTATPGLGLTISGLVLVAGGVVLLALPPSIGGERVPAPAGSDKTAARHVPPRWRLHWAANPQLQNAPAGPLAGPALAAF